MDTLTKALCLGVADHPRKAEKIGHKKSTPFLLRRPLLLQA
jgi:hypothetical protein